MAGGRPDGGGRQDGEDAAHRRRCFMTAVRHAAEAAGGRCVRLYVLLPFRAASPFTLLLPKPDL